MDCEEVYRQSSHTDKDADGSCDDCGYILSAEAEETPSEETGFSWFFLIPLVSAVAVAIPLALKKRK